MRAILILLAVIVVGGGVYLYLNAGSIVEQIIERVGTDATGTSVQVGSVDLNLNERTAAINSFTIANPSGFSGGDAFSLDLVSVSVDSVNQDLIVLSEVVVAAPQVLYEFNESGASNFDVLRANIQDYQTRIGGSGGGGGSGGSDTKIIIDRLRFTGGNVTANAAGQEVNVDLPPLTLTDIGRASGGQTAGQVAAQVADRLTQHVAQTVARSEIERRLGIEGLGDDNVVDEVIDGVRGIFGQ